MRPKIRARSHLVLVLVLVLVLLLQVRLLLRLRITLHSLELHRDLLHGLGDAGVALELLRRRLGEARTANGRRTKGGA